MHPGGDQRAVLGVLAGQELPGLVDPVDQVAPLVRHQRPAPRPPAAAAATRSAPAARRCPRPVRAETTTASGILGAQRRPAPSASARSALLITISSGTSPAPMSASTVRTALIWPTGSGSDAVDHVHQQVGLRRLLQGRGERLDQVVRQVPDEADGVGQGVDPAVGGLGPPGGRVQGGEQRVLDQHPGAGEPVQQAGLAGVGVADDGDRRHLVPPPLGPLGLPGAVHLAQRGAQLGDPAVDPAPVGLELGLTGATAADAGAAAGPAAGLPGQVATPAAEPLLQVLQLGQLDLGLALGALGVLGEDVQDQRGPVDHLDLDLVLQVAQLRRARARRRRSPCRRRWRPRPRAARRPCRGRCRSPGPGRWRRWIRPSSTCGAGGLGQQLELGRSRSRRRPRCRWSRR